MLVPLSMVTDAASTKVSAYLSGPTTPGKNNNADRRHEFAVKETNVDESPGGKDGEGSKIRGETVKEFHRSWKSSQAIDQLCDEALSTRLQDNHKSDKGGADEVDSIRTPQQKPRRKKHRPKVIIDAQQKRTPKNADKEATVLPGPKSVKKYVRRKVLDDSFVGGNIQDDINEKASSSTSIPLQKRRNSCRTSLNFNLEDKAIHETSSYFQPSNGDQTSCKRKRTDPATSSVESTGSIVYNHIKLDRHSLMNQGPAGAQSEVTAVPTNQVKIKRRSKCSTGRRDSASLVEVFKRPAPPGVSATMTRTMQGINILHPPDTCMEAPVTGRPLALTWKHGSHVDSIAEQRDRLDQNGMITNASVQKKNTFPSYSAHDQEQHALVPFQGSGAVVPFDRSFEPVRRKPRPKVDLDDETTRVWKLLLENINSEGIDGTDEAKAKWWEGERRLFEGRANSFIARMHRIQGDRRFSPWKGSVVDSVVGVFLTQNVSDHLSSSAFMSLAAQFPVLNTTKIPTDELHEVGRGEELSNAEISRLSSESSGHNSIAKTQSQSLRDATGSSSHMDSDPKVAYSNKRNANYQHGMAVDGLRAKSRTRKSKENHVNWDDLRKQALAEGKRKRTDSQNDSVDWDAVRCADVHEIADAIKERGMNNVLARRIKDFLNRLVQDHGSIDLEWLRDIPPDKAKDYLLSIRGLGLKSVECVRLLTLHHLAFPVDTNVGRIVVRLGWVPLQLPESLQLHLLELYPVLQSVQKYLWPRLCKLDQRTLYELHYQMITFGKVFCTKSKPNCNACPMRAECRHFASAFASSKLALPAPEGKRETRATYDQRLMGSTNTFQLSLTKANQLYHQLGASNSQPIIEEPHTPKPIIEMPGTPEPQTPDTIIELPETPETANQVLECDIEDFFRENPDDMDEFSYNVQEILQRNAEFQEADMSKALVALTSEAASIPVPKLKNVGRLRTEHQVYELQDSHPLLKEMYKRESDDPSPYLLAIWNPGESGSSVEPPQAKKLCSDESCSACNSIRETNSLTVRGTILIPCRTVMRGRFPLNGTYFQVNEVFSDHESSLSPIAVPRKWLWNLPRRTVFFGTSMPTIFRGLTKEEIQDCFWGGFVCVRGFERKTGAPRPLLPRFHSRVTKYTKSKGTTDETVPQQDDVVRARELRSTGCITQPGDLICQYRAPSE